MVQLGNKNLNQKKKKIYINLLSFHPILYIALMFSYQPRIHARIYKFVIRAKPSCTVAQKSSAAFIKW